MRVRVSDFRFSDPDYPADLGQQLLPHSATKFLFEAWFEADVPIDSTNVSILLEGKGGLGGVQWTPIAISNAELNIADGRLSYFIPRLPTEIRPVDTLDRYEKRLTLAFAKLEERYTLQYMFGRSQLPAYITNFRVFDLDRPDAGQSSDRVLTALVKRLGIDFEVSGEVLVFDMRITLRKGPKVVWEERRQNVRNGDYRVVVNQLPSEIVPANGSRPNDYYVDVAISAEGYVTSRSRKFSIGRFIPEGLIEIKGVAVNKFPVFDVESSNWQISDIWDRSVFSVLISTSAYDPNIESEPAIATVFFNDRGRAGESWKVSAEVLFDDSGTGWAFIDRSSMPPFDSEGEKTVIIEVSHNGRSSKPFVKNIPFVTGFRPDRLIDFSTAVVIGADNSVTNKITRTSKAIRVNAKVYEAPQGPTLTACLVLLPKRRRGSYAVTARITRTVSFARISTIGTGISSRQIHFELPILPNELFEFGHVSAKITVQSFFASEYRATLEDIGDFEAVASKSLTDVSSSFLVVGRSSSHRRQKPPVDPKRLSGKHWCSKFPTSVKVDDLEPVFAERVRNFVQVLESNGGRVHISATLRPSHRAFLMHYAWLIGGAEVDPGKVPKRSGVDIIWNHDRALNVAQEMVATYGIVHRPAFPSLHEVGRAIDMTITNLPKELKFTSAGNEVVVKIGTKIPSKNPALWEAADRYFRIAKLPGDPPHWYRRD